jgi:dihydrofolate reductase
MDADLAYLVGDEANELLVGRRPMGRRDVSGKVVVNRSMSLDGFIAGPGDAMDWIFDFMSPDAAWLTEIAAATGAMLVGRRTDEVGDRMDANQERSAASSDEGYPFSGPTFVLTHRPPDPPAPDVTYLTGDIREAVATALDAAGGKNLEILGAGGAGQCLRRGLVDEILVYVLPAPLNRLSRRKPRCPPALPLDSLGPCQSCNC